jgi:Holliday junction resolvase
MKNYSKGYRAERAMVHELSRRGYVAIRAPHSGSIGVASPDIVAAKDGKMIVMECKSREGAFTVPPEQLDELKKWRDVAKASAYIAWKINRKGWTFLPLEDVINNNGNIGKRFGSEKGIGIDDI